MQRHERPLSEAAADRPGVLRPPHGRIERIVVGREGDTPVVAVYGLDVFAVVDQREVLEVGDGSAPDSSDDGPRRGCDAAVRVAGGEGCCRRVGAVARYPRPAGYTGERPCLLLAHVVVKNVGAIGRDKATIRRKAEHVLLRGVDTFTGGTRDGTRAGRIAK